MHSDQEEEGQVQSDRCENLMMMLESSIMKRRTTITAEADDLEILRFEAARLGIPVGELIGELVAAKASEIQAARRPRLGLGRSGGARLSDLSVANEEEPAATAPRG
jgi:hypothetical protein